MTRFEDRHRELREAGGAPTSQSWEFWITVGRPFTENGRVVGHSGPRDFGVLVAAPHGLGRWNFTPPSIGQARLLAFEHNAGPLVDDLVAAVRRDYELADAILAAADDEAVLLANERLEVRRQVRELVARLDEEGCGG